MRQVVVTGLGSVSSIGHTKSEIVENLSLLKHGFAPFPHLENERCPPQFYGSLSGFTINGWNPEDWVYPPQYRIARSQLKSMSPHVLFSHCAVMDALDDAGLNPETISNKRTGLYSASSGSAGTLHHQMNVMNSRGPRRCSPFSVVASTVGTINFNLGASLGIQGAICGMASACASSAHALGFAWDAIASGRQDRMIVIGAEDGSRESILPFATMRALSTETVAERASCPFDANRSGFVGAGGAAVLILESAELAEARSAKVYAELKGWGEAGDGFSPAMSHPEGAGLIASMRQALDSCGLDVGAIDYVNAHATSTPVGDLSEIRALQAVFSAKGARPMVSSTKALTGHPLSMAGALEGVICCLALEGGFAPGSAHIETLDPACDGLNIIQDTQAADLELVLSNSCGFGGANVSLIFKKWPA